MDVYFLVFTQTSEPEPEVMKPPIEPVRRRSVTPMEPPLLTIGKRSLTPSSRSSSPHGQLAKNSPRLSNTANRVNKDTALHALTALFLPDLPQANPDQSPARKKELIMSVCYNTEVRHQEHTVMYHKDNKIKQIEHDIKHKAKALKESTFDLSGRYSQDEGDMDDECVWPGPSLSDEDSQEESQPSTAVDTEEPRLTAIKHNITETVGQAAPSEGDNSDSESLSNFLHPRWACLTGCRFHPPYRGPPMTPESIASSSLVTRPKRARASSAASSVDGGTTAAGGKKKARMSTPAETPDSSYKETMKDGNVISTSTPARVTRQSGAEFEFSSGEELSAAAGSALTGAAPASAASGGIPTLAVRPRRQSPQVTAAASSQQ